MLKLSPRQLLASPYLTFFKRVFCEMVSARLPLNLRFIGLFMSLATLDRYLIKGPENLHVLNIHLCNQCLLMQEWGQFDC